MKGCSIEQALLEIEAEKVLNKIPLPFGSLEKAKYLMYHCRERAQKYRDPIYSFVTTVHNTEECIEIMKSKAKKHQRVSGKILKYFTIYKETAEGKTILFSTHLNRP